MCAMKIDDRFEEERGEVVELIPCGDHLPDGLSEGFQVRVVRRVAGDRRLVEREGREWVVGAGQIRLRRRVSPTAPAGGLETWNVPLRAVRPRVPDRSGILASSPGFRRPGH
jgi:hypothetical protein